MAQLTDSIKKIAETDRDSASSIDWKECENKLDQWMKYKKKNLIYHYFDDPLFGACYTLKKYKNQIKLFAQSLKMINKLPNVKSILESSEKIVSFGCGPGPEIVAYIGYIRKSLNRSQLPLDITAVDRLPYWGKYISRLNEMTDPITKVQFRNECLSEAFLQKMQKSDVCIMLFPHSMNFSDFWSLLKTKFTLVILIDILSKASQNKMKSFGFTKKENQHVGIYTFVNMDLFYSKIGRNAEDVSLSELSVANSNLWDHYLDYDDDIYGDGCACDYDNDYDDNPFDVECFGYDSYDEHDDYNPYDDFCLDCDPCDDYDDNPYDVDCHDCDPCDDYDDNPYDVDCHDCDPYDDGHLDYFNDWD